MRKLSGALLPVLLFANTWVSAQCSNYGSVEPTCTEVLANGDMRVYYNQDSLYGASAGTQISEIRLYYSATQTFAGPPVATEITSTAFQGFIDHTGINHQTSADAFYQFEAVCVGPPSTVLPRSSVIRAVKLQGIVQNDFEVNLAWNWDSLNTGTSAQFQTNIQRSFPLGQPFFQVGPTLPFSTTRKYYTDTVVSCEDSVSYYVEIINTKAPFPCKTVSNVIEKEIKDNTGPDMKGIDSIGYNELNNRPVIGWTSSDADDTEGYYIYELYDNDCAGGFNTDSTVGRANTLYTDLVWWDNDRPAMYSIQAYDQCDQRSIVSECVEGMWVIPTLDVCKKSVRLDWNHYEGFASGTDVLYKVMVSINGSNYVLAGPPTTEDFFEHTDPLENAQLRYKIVAFENGGAGPFTASSNRVDVDAEFLKQPEHNYLRFATIQGEDEVRLELYTDIENDSWTYYLKSTLDTNDVFETVNIIDAPQPKYPADTIVGMTDRSAQTDRFQYYYQVDLYDSCGAFMTSTNVVSTSMLEAEPDHVRRVNRLEWTNVTGWEGGTFEYKVHKFLDDNEIGVPTTVFPDSGRTTVYYDSLLLYNVNETGGRTSRGKYCYYIEAVENEPTYKGLLPAKAVSNYVCVIQQPYISMPNAFTPNGDGKNETYRPTVVYHDISNYNFYVMNRYGEVIYQTSNVNASWDGTYGGKPLPQGVYVYIVEYRASSGQQFEEKGTITLVR